MQANNDAYLLGTNAEPLMSASEEIDRARKIRNFRREMWISLLRCEAGPRVVLATLRDTDPETAKRLSHRLQRLARQEDRTDRALEKLADAIRDVDRSGELSDAVLATLRAAGEPVAVAERLRDRWHREKDRFVLANMGLVFKVAGRFRITTLSLHDLVQDGALGLMRAVDMFDPDKGFRFSTYAVWWIRHAMGRAIADRSRTIRVPVHLITLQAKLRRERPRLRELLGREPTHEELAEACHVTAERVGLAEQAFSTSVVSLEQPRKADYDALEVPDDDDPRESMDFRLAAGGLEQMMSGLDRMEIDVLRKRFGLEQTTPMTLQEIGHEYALSRERIRQIELKALQKMRSSMGTAEA